ncbi:threonyl and Alanyl tRNA synthetase second additional domain protein [Burkholderia thailandensis 34]|uniref:alanyl-tRNA editing protein n=1 Tax=Burkholderia thailandensis TaxID=57975 RepID=UPI0005DA4D62|nr:alanyl-tRNA editing protein [Burkholderia thailandensis]AJY30278.1 threonyl and Alanyl tRNA synthetase second additional domain protein [Burkholderia thailandensis 34]AOJ56283.1 Ala-tRNA(Pro) hydrolase [Burkholderia thailandensis]KXF62026.1 Ala-tRNA(Pro) hydrolase [Burkholderia thailandensis]PNE76249.1 alanyl-tRNA editing protein [Burkholderia thailandensis]
MATQALFREDAYLTRCDALVTAVDEAGIHLDRTVFYPLGGGQAGDTGTLTLAGGAALAVADTRKAKFDGATPDDAVHVLAPGQAPLASGVKPGDAVVAEIDWASRHRRMRLHTASHLLCAVLPYPVDGCSVTAEYVRIDFATVEPIDREQVETRLAELVGGAHPVTTEWITDEEMAARPELVRTMSVKPPMGLGRVRLLRIEGVDLQPCGGTHVRNTAEIGALRVAKLEKKSARTRRLVLELA